MKRLLPYLLIFGLLAIAPPLTGRADPLDAVVRVQNQMPDGSSAWTTGGVVRWKDGQVVLTASHLVRGGSGRLWVHSVGGRVTEARRGISASHDDLLILELDRRLPGARSSAMEWIVTTTSTSPALPEACGAR